MIVRIIRFFWADLHEQEIKKFGLLATIYFIIISNHCLLQILKNTLFYKIAFPVGLGCSVDYGRLMQPIAKFWTPLIIIACILIYSKLVDVLKKEQLFYLLSSLYILFFATITCILALRHFFGDAFLGKHILFTLGWGSYFIIDSFGCLIITLFWSFTASVCTTESAKRGFPLIATMAPLGAIIGSIPTLCIKALGGIWILFLSATCLTAFGIIAMYYFMQSIPGQQLVGNVLAHQTEGKSERFLQGFISGFQLLLTKPYLLCVLVVSVFYKMISQIVEYQLHSSASFHPYFIQEDGFAQFNGIYIICVNVLAFLISLLASGFFLKRFGMRFCLILYPICLATAFVALILFFSLGHPTQSAMLWAPFGLLIIANGIGYPINNTAKEITFVPTSTDVKFKSKAWIDMFGSRMAKQGGAVINYTLKDNIPTLLFGGLLCSLGLVAIWLVAALFVAKKYQHIVTNDQIIQ